MLMTLLAAAISVQPVVAEEVQYRSNDIAGALKRGCKVQRVGGPTGKVEQPALIRCPAQRPAGSAEAATPRRGS
jgi:hypothetical protein